MFPFFSFWFDLKWSGGSNSFDLGLQNQSLETQFDLPSWLIHSIRVVREFINYVDKILRIFDPHSLLRWRVYYISLAYIFRWHLVNQPREIRPSPLACQRSLWMPPKYIWELLLLKSNQSINAFSCNFPCFRIIWKYYHVWWNKCNEI